MPPSCACYTLNPQLATIAQHQGKTVIRVIGQRAGSGRCQQSRSNHLLTLDSKQQQGAGRRNSQCSHMEEKTSSAVTVCLAALLSLYKRGTKAGARGLHIWSGHGWLLPQDQMWHLVGERRKWLLPGLVLWQFQLFSRAIYWSDLIFLESNVTTGNHGFESKR